MTDEVNTGIGISPLAILAAILFNYGKAEKVQIEMDDTGERKEILAECMGIESEGDAVVCCIPVTKILKYAQSNYNFKFKVVDGEAQMSFEKAYNKTPIYTANGQPVETESPTLEKLFGKLR